MLPLSPGKLDAETHDVANQQLREDSQESEAEDLDEAGSIQCTCSLEILVSHIIHTEEQSRNQGDYHKAHDALRVDGIVDAGSALRCRIRHVQEALKTVKHALEGMQLTSLLEVRLYLIEIIS